MADFRLPDLGEGVTEAEIDKWLVQEGDVIGEDAPLVEVITDKATAEIPSPFEGRVARIHVPAGEVVPVGTILVTIEGASEISSGSADAALASPVTPQQEAAETPDQTPAEDREEPPTPAAEQSDSVQQPPYFEESGTAARAIKATPPVRRLARELGVDLASLRGSGPGHRITREDVENAAAEAARAQDLPVDDQLVEAPAVPAPPPAPIDVPPPPPAAAEAPPRDATADAEERPDELHADDAQTPARRPDEEEIAGEGQDVPPPTEQEAPSGETQEVTPSPVAQEPPAAESQDVPPPPPPVTSGTHASGGRREPLRGIRRTIAQRMAHAHLTVPPVTHVEECDVTELDETRKLANERHPDGPRLTFLPFIVKAVVSGLKEFPALNATLDDEASEIVFHDRYDIGVAVDTPGGLVVPVLHEADGKSLTELAAEIDRVAGAAREGSLSSEDLRGSTFTITSPGPFGGLMATPIVFHPQTGILGVHRASERPVVRNGQIVIRKMMNLSITFDHRVLDGMTAAKFALHVVQLLEHPAVLTLEA